LGAELSNAGRHTEPSGHVRRRVDQLPDDTPGNGRHAREEATHAGAVDTHRQRSTHGAVDAGGSKRNGEQTAHEERATCDNG